MMTIAVIAIVFILTLVVAVNFLAPVVNDWLARRETIRRSAADQQMQALRAVQELSLLAWRARRDLYDLYSGRHTSQTRPPSRRR